jgi:Ca2+-binding EF-hand superfamily protein
MAAAAEPGSTAPADSRPALNARQRELLAQFDRNRDGRIDDDEKLAARSYMRGKTADNPQERTKKALKLFDKNADGKLDETEKAAAEKAREKLQANREAALEKADANNDGVLDADERAAALKAREERQKRRLDREK